MRSAVFLLLTLAAPCLGASVPDRAAEALARAEQVLGEDGYQRELPGVDAAASTDAAAGRGRRGRLRMALPAAAGVIANSLAWVLLAAVAVAALVAGTAALLSFERRRRGRGDTLPAPQAPSASNAAALDADPRSLAALIAAGAWTAVARRFLGLAIDHLASRRQRRLAASTTSREILRSIEDQSEQREFAALVTAVEQAHFGTRVLDRGDYERLELAYRRLCGGARA